jgi:hypothetical protein
MTEIVFNAPDADFLASEAARLGFANEDGTIITNGTFASGGGFFLNIVGTIYEPIEGPVDSDNPPQPVARPGYWGRLRMNGTPETMPTFSSAIIQYAYSEQAEGWVNVADGTPAPEFIQTVGVIA